MRLVWEEFAGGVFAAEVEPFWVGPEGAATPATELTEPALPADVGRLALLLRLEPKPRLFSRELIASTGPRNKWK